MLRRVFFTHAGGIAAALGFQSPPAPAPAPASGARSWQPARHEQDDWFEALPGKHRVFFDTWTASRFPDSLRFAGNIYRANRDGYGLTEQDLAVVICARHETAPFAFNDAMWAKYGTMFSARMEWVDPTTKEPPKTNVHTRQLSNFAKQGVHFAICSLTTRSYTQIIAEQTKRTSDEVFKELAANTVGPSHFVPAGVVAATRAQERGYSIISIG